jgi:hypothetical protein
VSSGSWLRRRRAESGEPPSAATQVSAESAGLPTTGDVMELPLPSADSPLCFTALVFVHACWTGPAPAPPALLDIARGDINRRARDVGRCYPLTASDQLRFALNTALYRWGEVHGIPVRASGYCERIHADPELVDAVAAKEAAARRRLVRTWLDEQRAIETEQMTTLILDPLRATASWYMDNPDKPEQAVSIAEKFQELRRRLLPEQKADSPGTLMDDLLTAADDVKRSYLHDRIGQLFKVSDREDLVMRLESLRPEARKS